MDWEERRGGWKPHSGDARRAADVDYARIVHSGSFRRLQGKTQILNLGDSDFYRTRLTHSLEVAQVAGSIVRQLAADYHDHPATLLLPELLMIQAIGFTHDLGHPPFGHGGEVALNYCMRGSGGFEGNGQTLRILSRLEKFSEQMGADLTRRTLLGTLKYPAPFSHLNNTALAPTLMEGTTTIKLLDRSRSKPPKCYMDCEQDVVDWILQPLTNDDRAEFTRFRPREDKHAETIHKSFDCSIMDLADDISFGIHDMEDSIALKLFCENDFRKHVPENRCAAHLDYLKQAYPNEFGNNVYEGLVGMLFGDGKSRKHAISRMVGHLIKSCTIETVGELQTPMIRYRANMKDGPKDFLKALRDAVRDVVILSPAVQHLEFKGQQMVVAVFEALVSEPKTLLPQDALKLYKASNDPKRIVCDHVAGMTDSFLLKTYERLFSPRMGSVFDKL